MSLNELGRQSYEIAKNRGKYPKDIQFKHIKRAFINELDELEEALISGKIDGSKDSVQWESMDLLAISLSFSHFLGIDIDKKFREVMEFNKRR